MSSATDVLIYTAPSDKENMAKLNELIEARARFGPHATPLDTSKFNGPNTFYGDVYSFGADYFLSHELQELVDSIAWKKPMEFAAIVTNMWDTNHHPEVDIVRPKYTNEPGPYGGWYGDREVTQQVIPLEDDSE